MLGGVPLNVMEIVKFPSEGSPDKQKAIEVSCLYTGTLVKLVSLNIKHGHF